MTEKVANVSPATAAALADKLNCRVLAEDFTLRNEILLAFSIVVTLSATLVIIKNAAKN